MARMPGLPAESRRCSRPSVDDRRHPRGRRQRWTGCRSPARSHRGEDDVDRRVGTGRHLDRGRRRRVETVRRSDGQGVVAWRDAPISICPASPLSSSAASSQTEMTDEPSSSATQAPGSDAPSSARIVTMTWPSSTGAILLFFLRLLALVPRFGTSIHEWKLDGVVLGHDDRRLGGRCETFGRLRLDDGVLTGRQIRDVELTIVLAVADLAQLDRSEHVEACRRTDRRPRRRRG